MSDKNDSEKAKHDPEADAEAARVQLQKRIDDMNKRTDSLRKKRSEAERPKDNKTP